MLSTGRWKQEICFPSTQHLANFSFFSAVKLQKQQYPRQQQVCEDESANLFTSVWKALEGIQKYNRVRIDRSFACANTAQTTGRRSINIRPRYYIYIQYICIYIHGAQHFHTFKGNFSNLLKGKMLCPCLLESSSHRWLLLHRSKKNFKCRDMRSKQINTNLSMQTNAKLKDSVPWVCLLELLVEDSWILLHLGSNPFQTKQLHPHGSKLAWMWLLCIRLYIIATN